MDKSKAVSLRMALNLGRNRGGLPSTLFTTIRGAVLMLSLCASCLKAANDGPPESLIRENCTKATAVLEGTIQSSNTPRGSFTATTIRIAKVFRGPFKAGDNLTYYFFKETGAYSQNFLRNGVIVFLVSKPQPEERVEWGTATDLSEFESSVTLEKRVVANLRRKP